MKNKQLKVLICALAGMYFFGGTINAKDHLHVGDNEHGAHAHEHNHKDHVENEHKDHAEPEHDEHTGDVNERHGGHKGHKEGHAEQGHEDEGLRLTPEQRKRFGIVVEVAGPGSLRNEVSLPGEIVFNEDRVVHIVPRVAGIVREVHKSVGNRVTSGETLVVIESRELADTKSGYLATWARTGLAEKNFHREKVLREKEVSSEQDYLEAEQVLAEARIELRSSEQQLLALGLTEKAIEALKDGRNEAITRYTIVSPIDGVVTEKHVALGESLEANAGIFTIVDMSSVWVNLTVYTKNLAAVRLGQEILLRVDHSGAQARGKVSMVTPFAKTSTRSATARVVLDNSDGRWTPGTFVTGFISISEENLPVVVPQTAVQNIEGKDVVFVEHEDGFEMTPVTVGRSDRTNVEIIVGLKPGTPYVVEGAFQLKATIITSNLGGHAGHGH